MNKEKQEEFRRHVALYAKGFYVRGNNPVDDLMQIGFNTGFLESDILGWEEAFRELVSMTRFCFFQLGKETHEEQALSSSPYKEFTKFVRFLHVNRDEIVYQHGLTPMTLQGMSREDIEGAQFRMLEYALIEALLVTIAKWNPGETELGDPSHKIMIVRDPKPKEKGKKTK